MAKKREPTIIHPAILVESIAAYRDDANQLLATSRHALTFMEDNSLDPKKVCEAVAPMLKEAVERMARWNDARVEE